MTVEKLNTQIQQKQAEIKTLVANRNTILFESFKPRINKYYRNEVYKDQYMFVDYISKDTFRPFGYEISYKNIRFGCMDTPEDWTEISKEEFEKFFNVEIDRLRKEMKL